MSSIPARDRGLTDPLDPVVRMVAGDRLDALLDAVDARAGVRVDDDGIELRRLLTTRRVDWDDVARIELDSRLDTLLAAATRFLPVRRVPVVGGLLTDAVTAGVSQVTAAIGVQDLAGWTLATIHPAGRFRRDVDVEGGAWLTALFDPDITDAVTAHARMRHIEVERR